MVMDRDDHYADIANEFSMMRQPAYRHLRFYSPRHRERARRYRERPPNMFVIIVRLLLGLGTLAIKALIKAILRAKIRYKKLRYQRCLAMR